MTLSGEKFLAVLKIELRDALESLKDLLESFKKAEAECRISGDVCRGNPRQVRQEIAGIEALLEGMDAFPPETRETPEAAREAVRASVAEGIARSGYPEVLNLLVDRKIRKVLRFLTETE